MDTQDNSAMDGSGSGGGGGSGSGRPSPKLQGPRPTPLKVNKDSHKIIKKPPVAPPQAHLHSSSSYVAQPQPAVNKEERQPVIIYSRSPRIIHTKESDFKSLVQRLTGSRSVSATPVASPSAAAGDLSPAARFASIERTSPSEREIRNREKYITGAGCSDGGGDDDNNDGIMGILEGIGVELSQNPGILSPSPATLPSVPAELFSPAYDPYLMHGINNMFIPSPSTLFSAPMVSPSPSSIDSFNLFFDF